MAMLKLILTLALVAGVLFQVSLADSNAEAIADTSVDSDSGEDDADCEPEPSEPKCKKPNEVYEVCPATCPFRTCGIDDRVISCTAPPKPGDPKCPKSKCRCKQGYYRDSKGNCVRWEQCRTECTGPNEIYDPCDAPCPARRCDFDASIVRCKSPPNVGDEECLIGCRCQDGYLRNDKGVCVAKDQCPKKCNINEYYDPCPDCRPETCRTINQTYSCPLIPTDVTDPRCKAACRCLKGYARDNNGDCVPVAYCPKCTGANQVYDPCPGCSPQTCETRDKVYHCPLQKCKGACRCKRGYFKNKIGECISAENCAKCSGKNEYWSCGSACDNRCDSKYGQDNCNIQNIVCNKQCYCEKNYARATNGTCIPKKDCQYECPKNERYDECPATVCGPKKCSEAGFPLGDCPLRNKGDPCPGKPGCVCNDGYLRNSKGVCVPTNECPSCGGDKNATLGCGVNCGRLCSNYKRKDIACILVCYSNACDCRNDYVFDSNTKQCVLPKDCTPVCKENEVYSTCINGGCQKKKCSDLNKPTVCIRPKICKDGCLCADGYLRAKNGTCVPIEQCDAPLPTCKANEEFLKCGLDGCKKRYCSDLDLPPLCRDTFTCTPSCECKEGYLRASTTNDTCVAVDQCPPISCNGDKNARPGCGVNCGRLCSNYNSTEGVACPEICNVNGCDCKEGFVLDDNTGLCVKPEECSNSGKCPKNEVLVDCPQASCTPKTCEQAGNPIACPRFKKCPGKPGCLCAEGYLRNSDGVCIPQDQCPSCGGDENAKPGCGVNCGRLCSNYNSTEGVACPEICNFNGCDCKEGFVLDDNTQKCVKPENCNKCPKNEILVDCPEASCFPKTCEQTGTPIACPSFDKCPGKPGCLCANGYLRNSDGVCIPQDQCPSCGGDENAKPGCGVNCGRLCSNYNSSEGIGCAAICYLNGCDCKEGFVLDDNTQKCVRPENCTAPCGVNEEFSNCSNGLCRVQDCADKGKSRPCPPMVPGSCTQGCVCKEKFLKAKNGTCVPEDQCEEPEKCPKNEVLVKCPQALCKPKTCDQAGYAIPCPKFKRCPGKAGCVCDVGYLRNSDGICIPQDQCPSCNGDNNAKPGCGVHCGNRCSDYNSTEVVACPAACNLYGCDCKEGFVFDDNTQLCVKPKECTPTCGVNEQYSPCSNGLCRVQQCSDKGKKRPCPPMVPGSCRKGCVCPEKFLRSKNGTCVPEDQCDVPPDPICPKNEILVKCAETMCLPETCQEAGFPRPCPVLGPDGQCPGKPRCICASGSLRNSSGVCVFKKECPSCGGDDNAVPGCGVNCGRLCSNYKSKPKFCPLFCNVNGCDCKKDYVYDGNRKKCVLPNECTPTCQPTEIFSECSNGVCRPQKCADKGKSWLCPPMAEGSCKAGCVCPKKYLRADNGTCIPEDQCTTDETCPEGENFNKCPPPKCDGEYCPKTRNDPQTCPYPNNDSSNCGKPRCVCGFNSHRDRNTGKCIATSECPKFACDGPNESFNNCVPICPGETCTDYLNNATCPRFRIGIVVPCKLGCRCDKGYYRDSRNICIPGPKCKKCDGPPSTTTNTTTTVATTSNTCDAEAQQRAIQQGNTALNGKVLYQIAKNNPGVSVFMSAFSLLIALAQLALYSSSTTYEQLASILNVQNKSDIRCGFPGLLDSIKSTEGTVLDVAAKIYVYDQGKLSKSLENDSENIFRAKAESINFRDGAAASKIINKWVSDATGGKITDLVNADTFDDNTRLALINAINFKGLWKYEFNPNNTKPRDFYVSSDKTIQVPTMTQKGSFRYGEVSDLDVQVIEMPCKDENITVQIILPKKTDGLLDVLEKLQDPKVFNDIQNSLSKQTVTIYLPKINGIETKTDMKQVLKAIGVTAVFDPSEARLSGMTDPDEDLYVSQALQKAFCKIDEKGAEAAAATAVTIHTKSLPLPPPIEYIFKADHPFIFIIKGHSNLILFSGVFAN